MMLFSIYYILLSFISVSFVGTAFFLLFQRFFHSHWSEKIEEIANKSLKLQLLLLLIFLLPVIFDLIFIGNIRICLISKYLNNNFLLLYYNHNFILIRTIIYCVLFIFLLFKLSGLNLKTFSNLSTKTQIKYPSIYLVLLFIIGNFYGIDLLMSIQSGWSSAIWGIYFISISYITAICLSALIRIINIKKSKRICKDEKELENIGKLIFGVNFFWAYLFYIQILIIMYGNLPKEMLFLDLRMESVYKYLFYFISMFHFILPSILLLPTNFKQNTRILLITSCLIIISTITELCWIILPVI